MKGTSLEKWDKLWIQALTLAGKDGFGGMKLKGVMEEVGFVDVKEEWFAVGGNGLVKGEKEKKLADMEVRNIVGAMDGFSVGSFPTFLGMSVEEVESLLVEVRRDVMDTGTHWYCAM